MLPNTFGLFAGGNGNLWTGIIIGIVEIHQDNNWIRFAWYTDVDDGKDNGSIYVYEWIVNRDVGQDTYQIVCTTSIYTFMRVL